MQTMRVRAMKKARWEPPPPVHLQIEESPPEILKAPTAIPETTPREVAFEDPWSRPETLPVRSGNSIMLWLLIPFVAVIVYGFLVR